MPEHLFSFGPFVLDASRGVLERGGAALPIGHRAMELLLALVRAQGRVLTKDELVRAAWPGAVIEDSNLSVQVAALRKALGTTPEGGDYVATVARVGYRFGAPVSVGGATASCDAGPSIVVLPLVNIGGDAAQQYFADGLTEDIIMALSRFRWFRVIGRHASFAFDRARSSPREFAQTLSARYALEGSVRRSGDRVALNVRLVDASDDSQLWGERFDLQANDAAAVHDTIAQCVAGAVEPELLKTASVQAARRVLHAHASVRDLVHRGTWLFHQVGREAHRQARDLFREACRLDPAFGEAQFWLARVSAGLCAYGWSEHPGNDLREGYDAAVKAIRADEKDPYAYYSLAIVSVFQEDFEQAQRAADRSVQLAPAFALGHLVGGMARLFAGDAPGAKVSLAEGLRLNRFDPQNFVWFNLLALSQLFCGEARDALENARNAQQVRPGWKAAIETEVCCLVELGESDRAVIAQRRLGHSEDPAGDSLAPLWKSQPQWARIVKDAMRAAGRTDGTAATRS
jgi:TolB-like protein